MFYWIKKYHNISLAFADQAIHVKNDQALEGYILADRGHVYELAVFIKKAYRHRYGKSLLISNHSLAVEIYAHYKIQVLFLSLEKRIGKTKFGDWMLRHMDVIDCGEMPVDNNRFLWDLLAPLGMLLRR